MPFLLSCRFLLSYRFLFLVCEVDADEDDSFVCLFIIGISQADASTGTEDRC